MEKHSKLSDFSEAMKNFSNAKNERKQSGISRMERIDDYNPFSVNAMNLLELISKHNQAVYHLINGTDTNQDVLVVAIIEYRLHIENLILRKE